VKKHGNTLYVTTQGSYLSKNGETVDILVEGSSRLKLPLHTLDGIVCFGQVSVSPFLMGACAERDVALSFLTERGRYLACVRGPVSGNVLMRREQYRRADSPEESAKLARGFLTGKIANSRTLLRRAVRDHPEKVNSDLLGETADKLTDCLSKFDGVSLDELRAIEGEASRYYFGVFDELITRNKEEFYFRVRSRRPPLDKVNCLLSFYYTLLCHDCRSALESVGLDPQVGFLHRDRPGRPSLALDLMEEFRAMISDRLALSLINLAQIKPDGFRETGTGGVLMDDDTRKAVVVAYQKRKQEDIVHPFLKEKMPIGLLFHVQAALLSRYIRNDLDGYPPFIMK
jgi:CRISPR-associated protein Cas1